MAGQSDEVKYNAKGKIIQPRITKEEIVAEAQWLLDGGLSPIRICIELERKSFSILRAAQRVGNKEVTAAFVNLAAEDRYQIDLAKGRAYHPYKKRRHNPA